MTPNDDPNPLASVPAWRRLFASQFTTSWTLGLLLFGCMFLPAFEGCNGKTIYPYLAFQQDRNDEMILLLFLLLWPYLFGLIVAISTWLMTLRRDTSRGRLMWGICLAICAGQFAFWTSVLVSNYDGGGVISHPIWPVGLMVIVFIALIRYTLRSKTWFDAAIRMQAAAATTAAFSLTFFTPVALFAKRVLIGGKLAVFAAVSLAVCSLIHGMDGARALNRKPGESPLQITMRQMLVLMVVGGVACVWVFTASTSNVFLWGRTEPSAVIDASTPSASPAATPPAAGAAEQGDGETQAPGESQESTVPAP